MSWQPTRAFSHSIFWGALALLVVNDHVLKGAGLLPGGITGKVSDVAGLLVAPWILAFLWGARTRPAVLLSHVVVGAGFAAINLSPPLARAVEELTAGTPFPWVITADPLDVLTLPALALSFVVLGAVARDEPLLPRGALVRSLRGLGFTLGLLACVATSRVPEERLLFGSLFVVSSLAESSVVTLRPLRDDVILDCDFVAEDPSRRLSWDLFAPVQTWELMPGDAVPLASRFTSCDAWLLGGGGASPALVFWRDSELPPVESDFETARTSPERSVFLVDEGEERRFSDHAARYAAPPRELPAPAEGCEAPPKGSLVWSTQPPEGTFVLDDITASPDGCYALGLQHDGEDERFFLCLAGEELPFPVGETLVIGTSPSVGGDTLEVTGDSLVLRVSRGGALALPGLPLFAVAREDCTGRFETCGSLVVPADVLVGNGGEDLLLSAGRSVTLSSGTRLFLGTALLSPVRDAACDPTELYLESFSLAEKP